MIYWHHDDLTVPFSGWHCGNCGARIPNGVSHACAKSTPAPQPAVGWRCPSCKSAWGPQVDGCKVCNRSEINT